MLRASTSGGQGLMWNRWICASFTAVTVDSGLGCPVRMIRPMSGSCARTRVRNSEPVITGIRSSETTTSTRRSSRIANASATVVAVATSNGWRRSAWRRAVTTAGSSSSSSTSGRDG